MVCLEPANSYHHIIYRSDGGDPDDYAPLCVKCHDKAHDGELTAEYIRMRKQLVEDLYNA